MNNDYSSQHANITREELLARLAELERSEKKYRDYFDNASDILFTTDMDGRFTTANPQTLKLLGVTLEQALHSTVYEYMRLESQKLALQKIQEKLAGSSATNYEMEIIGDDNRSIILNLSTRLIFENNNPVGIQGIGRDETDRIIAQKKLEASEARYRTLSEVSFEGIVISDNGICVEANQWVADVLGYEINELIGKETCSFGAPESYNIMARHMREGYELPYEVNLVNSRGEHIPVEIRGRMFCYLGREVRAITIRDLRERYWAREKISEQHRNFQALFHNTPDAVVFCNIERKITDINPRFYELFGYTLEECRGHYLNQVLIPDDKQSEYDEIMDQAYHGQSVSMESIRRAKSGQLKDVNIRVVHIVDYGYYAIYSDIGLRKQAENKVHEQLRELESKNAEMERFTYTVSHDLRSPLITIKGFAGLLIDDLKKQSTEHMEDDLQRICNAADNMDHLLRDLLELSRVGRTVNCYSEFHMGTLVNSVAELLTGNLYARGVKLEIAPDMPIVTADEARIQEVVQNLVENAIKFMGSQSDPLIVIGYQPLESEHQFHVRDNGIGIDPFYQHRIFDLFDQLDPRCEGTGIGLSLVKRIIEFHGGRIWVQSEGEGKGSTFLFTLPR